MKSRERTRQAGRYGGEAENVQAFFVFLKELNRSNNYRLEKI